ncbi:outer membrane protein transport protein [Paraglaciecola aquimarina]|uniref:Outer membrane protein transport protein n=1 Tax=Paraglaciecola algarum TaxID=3050085 RepID=A0ABS9D4G1_9ALTE|nr:outer membrane protein transport protein [Paraglaciecola sp. G1-23]MCF2947539.1 outer membrane protein transport protein [Paraglaciecola sp. G1-23]
MKLNRILMGASASFLSLNTFGAAFQLAEHSASGLGRAFAGDAAIAENASVVARNPALMSQFKQNQLSIVGTYVKPDVSLEGESAPAYSNAEALNNDSIAPGAFVPASYLVMPINNKWAVGLGLFSNFGLATDFADDYAAGQLAGSTEILTVNLNTSISYKISEQFSVAAGLNYVYAEAELVRHAGPGLPAFLQANYGSTLGVTNSTEVAKMDGDDAAFGWNIGMAWDVSNSTRLGLAHRSSVELDFEGEYSNQLPAALGGLEGNTLDGRLAIELPAITEFSASHQLDDKWGLHYSVMWTQWSSFDRLEAYVPVSEEPVFEKDENFSDSFRYAISADYQLNSDVKLRAGIAYDKTPSDPNHQSISIPDTNRLWLSAGATYVLNNTSSVDLGLSILRGENRSFTEADNLGGQWGFASEGNAAIFAAQYNYAF